MIVYRGYLHEVWLSPDEEGSGLPACLALGPHGDGARALILEDEPNSICVWVFWANSHLETMNIYYEFMDYGEYQSARALDSEPHPALWLAEQHAYLENL